MRRSQAIADLRPADPRPPSTPALHPRAVRSSQDRRLRELELSVSRRPAGTALAFFISRRCRRVRPVRHNANSQAALAVACSSLLAVVAPLSSRRPREDASAGSTIQPFSTAGLIVGRGHARAPGAGGSQRALGACMAARPRDQISRRADGRSWRAPRCPNAG